MWCRMRVVDELSEKARRKVEALSFCDFLEALVHVARMKEMPTDHEVRATRAGGLWAAVSRRM